MAFLSNNHVEPITNDGLWSKAMMSLIPATLIVLGVFGLARGVELALPSNRTVSNIQHQISLEHDIVGRVGRVENIDVTVMHPTGDPVTLTVDAPEGQRIDVIRSTPQANTIVSGDRSSTLIFQPQSADVAFNIILTVVPKTFGQASVRIRTSVGQSMAADVTYSHLVLP